MKTLRPNMKGFFPCPIETLGSKWIGQVALGNMTQYEICLCWFGEFIVVAIMDRGAYRFDSYVHWQYAKEHLGLMSENDAQNVADFINDQLSDLCGTEKWKRQGNYLYPDLLTVD